MSNSYKLLGDSPKSPLGPDSRDIQKLAAPVFGIGVVTLLLYAISTSTPSNEELSSILTNVVFLYPLVYSGTSSGLFVVQLASAVVGAASYNYHEHGIIGTGPPGSRQYPWHGDLFASLLVATTVCVAALDAAVSRFAASYSGVLRRLFIVVIVVLPFALDGVATPSNHEKPALLEPWAASCFVVGLVAAVTAVAESTIKGVFIGVALLVPLVAAVMPASGLVDEPAYNEERAVHAYWHATAAVTVSFIAAATGGIDPLIHLQQRSGGILQFRGGIVAGYLATGIALLVALVVDPGLAYTWVAPIMITVGVVAGVLVDNILNKV